MKELKDMSLLELKGVLYDLDNQIRQIQNYAQREIIPLIQNLEILEQKADVNIKNSTLNNSPIQLNKSVKPKVIKEVKGGNNGR